MVKKILRLIQGDTARISTDTRSLKKGDLFVALKGKNFNGHDFVECALEKCAIAAVVNTGYKGHGAGRKAHMLIRVEDTLKAYGNVAGEYRRGYKMPVIGVTGSNGKTTTKDMIHAVLSKRLNVLKSLGTENNLIGLPKTLFALRPAHDAVVAEMGTSRPGEIKRLSEILMPDIGVITNIGSAHLEFLNSEKDVFREKSSVIGRLRKEGLLLINADDPWLSKINHAPCRIIKVGIEKKGCDLRAADIRIKPDRSGGAFTEFLVNDRYRFRLNLLGAHNVYNALFAIALGFHFGMGYPEIRSALLRFTPQQGRLNVEKIKGIFMINDAYNANPSSTRA
ncbi:MAG: UDP-N-acetylmuramoyl-tripeptide--D-alanyl-D-alanine ligase, partial [Candidatus Omnitrophota bacterium]